MKRTARTTSPMLSVLLLALTACAASGAAEWPRFRGPDGAGIAAADAKPATTWSATKNLKWKAALPGPGSSSPIVAGARVFITCYSGYGDGSGEGGAERLLRHLVCVDRETGKIQWDTRVPAGLPEDNYRGYLMEHGYASSTPVTDGERVYVFFGKTGVLAFNLADNQLYAVSRRGGAFLLPAVPRFAVTAHNTLDGDDSDFNGTPAIVGRQLFLRSNRFLYCIEPSELANAAAALKSLDKNKDGKLTPEEYRPQMPGGPGGGRMPGRPGGGGVPQGPPAGP